MMLLKQNRVLLTSVNVLLFIIAIFVQYSPTFSLKIAGANTMLPLALLTALSMQSAELSACVSGLAVGVFVDCYANTNFGFNAIIFMLIAFAISFTTHYIFNNNIRSCAVVAVLAALTYFLFKWIFFYTSGVSAQESVDYFFKIAIPSVIYTAITALPLYSLEKYLFKKIS